MSASRSSFSAGRAASITVIVLLLALLVCEFAGWPFLRGPLARAMSKATGTPVTIEAPFHANLLWNPGVGAGRLRIAAPEGIAVPHLLNAEEVTVRWGWLDVWRWQQGGPLVLRALGAQQLDAQLVRTDASHASWLIGPQGEEKRPDAATRPALRIDELRVADGTATVDDALNDLTLQATLSLGEGAVEDSARGLRVDAEGQWRAKPLAVELNADAVMPLFDSNESDAAQPVGLQVDAQLGETRAAFDGTVASLLDARALKGNAQLSGPSLSKAGEPFGASLPHTPDFELKSALEHKAGVWTFDFQPARFGDSILSGALRFDSTAEPPRLDGKVSGKRLTLTDFGPVIGADTPPAASDRVLPDRPLDLPALQTFEADVKLDIASFDMGTPTLAPMRELRGQVVVEKGVLKLQSLHAQAVGGRFTGDIEIDSTAQPARWHAALRMAETDVGKWLRVDTPDVSSSSDYLTGDLQAVVDVTGYGRSTQAVLGSLEGQLGARLREGAVSHLVMEAVGLDLAQALGVAIGGDDPLALNCARLQAPIKKGVIEPVAAVLDNRDSTIRVDGRISLAEETLALRVNAKPKDFSLASLRSPVLIGGTLKNPEVGIDGSELAPQLLAAAAVATVAPLAAWVPLIDLGEDEQSDPCQLKPGGDAGDGKARSAESQTGESPETQSGAAEKGDQGISRAFTRERRYAP